MHKLALLLLLAAGAVEASVARSEVVTKTEFGSKWPLKVPQATLECRELGRIVLKANGKTYWFNGLASGAAKKNGWANLEDIWFDDPELGIPEAKKSMKPLNEWAQRLCQQ